MAPERPMRTGIDARIAYYSQGGIRHYVLHLITELAKIDRETEYVVLRSRKDGQQYSWEESVQTVSCWTPSHHRWERLALSLEIARLRLDLLHSPDFIPPSFGSARSVITIHDLNFIHYPQFLTRESNRFYNRQLRWAVSKADHILADSRATMEDLIALVQVPREKVTVVHLAADAQFVPAARHVVTRTLAKYGMQPGYLLYVGTLEPRKNVVGLLEAYRLLVDEGATAGHLVLVGKKGWLYEDIFRQVKALKLSERVHFLHRVPDTDLPPLYSGAAVFVLPSFYEGFGLPALEAMACGAPVVVADRASLPEVVGEAGLLVDPDDPQELADTLARVLGDSELAAAMSVMGQERAATFSWERTARETLRVYRRVAGRVSR
jgi:glycosyltransferase involved in cell wall biosynthesis